MGALMAKGSPVQASSICPSALDLPATAREGGRWNSPPVSLLGLPQLLEISGALVTIDAIGCQKEIADQVREREGDYVLAVKQNQPTLYEQVEGAIDEALEQDAEAIEEHQTVETGHGRQETRTYAIFPKPESVDPEGLWRDLSAVGIAISERVDTQGRGSIESRYYMLSRRISTQEFA